MSDALLAAAVGVIQLLLGVMGIYLALRPPEKSDTRKHLLWIVAFVIVGGSGVWLTYTLAKHADVAGKDATQKIQDAETAATSANAAATKANEAATAAQKETAAARIEAKQAEQSLSDLINKRSKETTNALVKLNATTETSVKGIPRPRRIPAELKTRLIADLSAHRGIITINRFGGGDEAMQFANDWHELLSQAGWTITGGINAVYAAGSFTGVRVTVKGEPVAPNEVFSIAGDHPASALARSLFAVTRDVIGQRNPNFSEGATVLDIGALPRSSN